MPAPTTLRARARLVPLLLAAAIHPPARAEEPRRIVLCAPGYPGTTAQAQPTMDAFAKGVARAAGQPERAFTASYSETEAGGIEKLKGPDAAIAIVTLPFFLEHGKPLALSPRLSAAEEAAPEETWTLVAKAGALTGPASLDGWEIASVAGYSRSFVLGGALGAWGPVPASAKVTFTRNVLTSLRRASTGEQVAVLLNREQTAALPGLPFAKDLAIAFASRPMPGSVLCVVGSRLDRAEAGLVLDALARMDDSAEGQALLNTMRLSHFALLRPGELDAVTRGFTLAGGATHAGAPAPSAGP